jgi:hypothetical protein
MLFTSTMPTYAEKNRGRRVLFPLKRANISPFGLYDRAAGPHAGAKCHMHMQSGCSVFCGLCLWLWHIAYGRHALQQAGGKTPAPAPRQAGQAQVASDREATRKQQATRSLLVEGRGHQNGRTKPVRRKRTGAVHKAHTPRAGTRTRTQLAAPTGSGAAATPPCSFYSALSPMVRAGVRGGHVEAAENSKPSFEAAEKRVAAGSSDD